MVRLIVLLAILGLGCQPAEENCDDTWCNIPGGTFQMGQEGFAMPVHQVTLSAYRIQKYEVTAGEYGACVSVGDCTAADTTGGTCTYNATGKEDHPINCVDWHQAKAYCQWLGGDLPTEAQWEYAARGGDGRIYPWGNESPGEIRLNYNNNIGKTTPVGSYPAGVSPFGLHDMAGNVMEWVADWYDSYPSTAQVDPTGPGTGTDRVLRGGNFLDGGGQVHAAIRYYVNPNLRYNGSFGFRCAAPE